MEREISTDNLLVMDADNNGQLSRAEYVQCMLREMGLVEAEEFDELHGQFHRLDVDGGGYLDKNDLVLMAELQSLRALANV
jgi:Ca2+-binding EF-hand superfamily protein